MSPTARRALACLLLAATACAHAADAAAPKRPVVGLVLGGGGARGAAHIGVLEVLERLRVPVDCVAGTSMGALVAGTWAAGLDPATMRRELARANWADLFQDNPDYTELNYRNKRLQQRFLPGTESGFGRGGLITPPGVVSGQKIKLFFNQLVRADAGERDIARLPLPVSIIATDIASGERVVLRDGSLTQAMRASMAVPGLLAPMEHRGRKLVDGGLVDNVPVREVRERCGAQVVIAVNVGSPLLKAEDIAGLLSVSAQMVNILTEQNVSRSLASLGSDDILIQPDLGPVGAGDFERSAEAADRGRTAAEGAAAALRRLSVSPAAYAAWRRRFEDRRPDGRPVDEVRIVGLQRVNPELVSRYIAQRPGEPLDVQALERDLLRVYGDGHYEGVDYALTSERERQVLRITPVEKRWGPDYLRLGVNLSTNLSQGSTYALRAGYQKTWLNRLGAELLLSAELGSNSGLSAEFVQPLDGAQRWFVEASAGYRRSRSDLYLDGQRVAEYRVGTVTMALLGGLNIGLLGQARAGWRDTRFKASLETGLPALPAGSARAGGWLAALDLDQLNGLYFPDRGWAARASWFDSSQAGYGRLFAEGRVAGRFGAWVLGSRIDHTRATHGTLAAFDVATLGGFLNLSGFSDKQLLGNDATYVNLRGERIVGKLPLGLRGDMRLGLALEAGRMQRPFTPLPRDGWLDSTTVYLGGETPLGPVYVGIGHSTAGSTNAYLFIGTP